MAVECLAGNWSAFAEYNYFDWHAGRDVHGADGVTTFPINIKQNINSFAGINYRFGASGYTNY